MGSGEHYPPRIYLTGFMGSGKSTVGPILANTLGYTYVDLDKRIEEKAGKPIVEIFDTSGEATFRFLEKETLREVSNYNECIISLGGGTIASDEIFELINNTGWLVYLRLSPEEVLRRLAHKTDRPMLKDENGGLLPGDVLRQRVLALLEQRESYYNRADIVVSTDILSVGKTVDEIVRQLRALAQRAGSSPSPARSR
jgi:shikimate kinase